MRVEPLGRAVADVVPQQLFGGKVRALLRVVGRVEERVRGASLRRSPPQEVPQRVHLRAGHVGILADVELAIEQPRRHEGLGAPPLRRHVEPPRQRRRQGRSQPLLCGSRLLTGGAQWRCGPPCPRAPRRLELAPHGGGMGAQGQQLLVACPHRGVALGDGAAHAGDLLLERRHPLLELGQVLRTALDQRAPQLMFFAECCQLAADGTELSLGGVGPRLLGPPARSTSPGRRRRGPSVAPAACRRAPAGRAMCTSFCPSPLSRLSSLPAIGDTGVSSTPAEASARDRRAWSA